MHYNPLSLHSFLWIVQILVEILVVRCIWNDRREWKAFSSYLVFHLIWDLGLFPLAISHQPKIYFYSYWWGRAILFALECLTVGCLIGRIVQPILSISNVFTTLIFVSSSAVCGIGWLISSAAATRNMLPITRFVLSAERGLTTVEALSILFYACLISVAAMRWTHTEAFITGGFVSQALSNMLVTSLLSFMHPRFGDSIQLMSSIADLVTFGLWTAAFFPVLQITPQRLIGDVE